MKTIVQLTASSTAWYSSNDEEHWTGGPYETREEAEAGAKDNEHRLICEATKGPIRVSRLFDQCEFIENAEERIHDLSNEDGDPILDFKPEVNLNLRDRVRKAIDEWQVAHQLAPMPWLFDYCSKPELAAWVKVEKEASLG
jgi:hypothetical protein